MPFGNMVGIGRSMSSICLDPGHGGYGKRPNYKSGPACMLSQLHLQLVPEYQFQRNAGDDYRDLQGDHGNDSLKTDTWAGEQ